MENTHPFTSAPPYHCLFFPSGEGKKAQTRQETTQSSYKMKHNSFIPASPSHGARMSGQGLPEG